jgi:phosphoglycolate phosphatase
MDSALRVLAGKRYELGILSSNSTQNIQRFLARNQLQLFAHIEGGSSMLGKARGLRKLMKARKLDPSSVLYVGDEVRDVEAAHEAGVSSVAVSWGYADRAALAARKPTHLIDRPEDLVSLL